MHCLNFYKNRLYRSPGKVLHQGRRPNPSLMAGKVRPNGRVGSLSEAPSSLPAAPGLGLSCCPLARGMNEGTTASRGSAVIRQQALPEHVLQARSFLGAQGMERQVNERWVYLTFKKLVPRWEDKTGKGTCQYKVIRGPSALWTHPCYRLIFVC